MALTNEEKRDLRRWIIDDIVKGFTERDIVRRMTGIGYKESTVKKYFKAITK